ncbi:MAG: hypothetical protein RJA87_46 [Pseudomonadota bacterium]|jgi:hypothetical protein
MTPERFEQLAEAYGSDLRRWPLAEQAKAEQLRQERPVWARECLDSAADLDDLLGLYRVAAPSVALRDRVMARAPKLQRSVWSRLVGEWRGWGMGLAAAGLAGLMVGIGSVSLMMADQSADVTVASALDGQSVYSEAVAFGAEEKL